MPRRAPLHALAPCLLAALLTAPALAQPGHAPGQKGTPGKGHTDERHQSADDRHGSSQGKARFPDHDGGHGDSKGDGQRQKLSPQQAAERARALYGGQVLKVSPEGNGYRVRLLGDDGRVMTVPVGD